MKPVVCPISSERIPVVVPRITALLVVLVLFVAIVAQIYELVALLAIDFFLRGFFNGRYSPLAFLSQWVYRLLNVKGAAVDKAPKIFAAKLGFAFSLLIAVAGMAQLDALALVLGLGLGFFAVLECFFGVCIGCYLYSWIVLPLSVNRL